MNAAPHANNRMRLDELLVLRGEFATIPVRFLFLTRIRARYGRRVS